MSQKRFMSQKVFLRHKNDTKITLAAIESACRISRKQADTRVSRCILMRSRASRHCDKGNFNGDIRGTIGAFTGVLRGLCEGLAFTIFTTPIKRRSLSAKTAPCYNAARLSFAFRADSLMRTLVILTVIGLLTSLLSVAQQPIDGISAQAVGQANLRAEPGVDFAIVGSISAGPAYAILGRSQFFPWILIGSQETGLPLGWVYETLVTVSGDINLAPISAIRVDAGAPFVTPTALPLLSPTEQSDSYPSGAASTSQPDPRFGVSGRVIGEVNIRYGPGIEYPRVGVALAGQQYDITGYHTQFPWVRIHYPSIPNQQAWIARDLLQIDGNLFNSPAISQSRFDLPPLPATPPAITVNRGTGESNNTSNTGFQILAEHLWNFVLEAGFDRQTSRFGALFVMDLQSGASFSFGDEYAFSGTSINKIAILAALYQHLDDPPSIEVATDIANTMICSENVATNRLLSIIGGGNSFYGAEAVTDFYDRLGWSHSFITAPFTTIGTPEPPPHPVLLPRTSADQQKANPDLTNQLTVSEIGALLAGLYDCAYRKSGALIDTFGTAFAPRECRQILHLMSNNTVDALLKAGVPADTRVAHKHGWIPDTHGNAALFFTPGRDYVIAMMLFQPSWLNFQESLPVIAEVSRRVYNYFNPERALDEIREGYIPDANSCNYAGDLLAVDLMQPVWPD